jgi:hypothetical protein
VDGARYKKGTRVNDVTTRSREGRSGGQPVAAARVSRQLWLLFWLLLLLQLADIASTYIALAAGAREGNVALRGLLHTPAIFVTKAFALVFLAILVVRSTTSGRPAPRRLLIATRAIALIYLAIVANNMILALRLH